MRRAFFRFGLRRILQPKPSPGHRFAATIRSARLTVRTRVILAAFHPCSPVRP